MDLIPSDYYAADGDDPKPIIRRLVELVRRDSRKTFQGVTVQRSLNGVNVVAKERARVFTGAWYVTLGQSNSVQFSPGTVNGREARLDEITLDGFDLDGEPADAGRPSLNVEEGPNERQRSYVGILVRINPETGAMDPEDPEALTMAHRPTLHPAFGEGGAPDEEGAGFWPVAQLQWTADGKRIDRVRQWAYFDYTHRFVQPLGGGRGRHFFEVA